LYDIDNERRIAVVADTHVGSLVAPWFPITDETECWMYSSAAQEPLLSYWYDFWKDVDDWDADTVFLLGDMANGNERKEFGRGLVTANLSEQVRSAIALIKPHCTNRRVHGIQGSPYHQAMETSLDELIVRGVGGEWHGKIALIRLEGPEKVAHLSHGDSASLIYRETDCARESLYMDAVEPMLGYHIDLVIRGHWHWYYAAENRSRWFVQAPGWKLWFPWKTKMWARMLPDLGGVMIRVTKKSITVDRRLYKYYAVHDRLGAG